jgi:Na+/citrate or Na+/malate symporter
MLPLKLDSARFLLACSATIVVLLLIDRFSPEAQWILLLAILSVVWLGANAIRRLGRAVPLLHASGLDVIACILLPSWLVAEEWLPESMTQVVRTIVSSTDLLVWLVIVFMLGGVASVDRSTILKVGSRVALPVIGASLAAIVMGAIISAVFFPVMPDAIQVHVLSIMAGGIASGALPLSIGLAQQAGQDQGELLARMLPSVIMANLVGFLIAGILGMANRRQLVTFSQVSLGYQFTKPAELLMSMILVIVLYVFGLLVELWTPIPRVMAIVFAVFLLAMTGSLNDSVRRGTLQISGFVNRHLLFPLMWIIGMAVVQWVHVLAGFSIEVLGTAVAIMVTLAGVGWALTRLSGIEPVDGALVALARGVMGGTGALLLVKSADRVDLLPCAILSVRIGGAITLVLALNLQALLTF